MVPKVGDFFHIVRVEERPVVGDAETSSNFDMDEVQPFLENLHAFSIPLGRLDVIAELMANFPQGYTHDFEAVGVLDNQRVLVTIRAFICDVNATDLTFIAPEPIIDFINTLLSKRD